VQSHESRHKEFEGRKWQIVWDRTGLDMTAAKGTELGQKRYSLRADSHRFLTNWLAKLRDNDLVAFYLLTRPAAERETLRNKYQSEVLKKTGLPIGAGPLAQIAKLSDQERLLPICMPGYLEFSQGSLVRAEDFWAPQMLRAEVVADLKKRFRNPGTDLLPTIAPEQEIILSRVTKDNEHLRVAHDATLRVEGKYLLEAEFVLETEASAEETGQASDWRVVSLQLQRARNWPRMPGPGGGMPRPPAGAPGPPR